MGWELHLGNQMSAEIKMPIGGPDHVKVKRLVKNTQPFRTNPRHLEGRLGTCRNYSRVVHLGWEVHLGSQMSAEIKIPIGGPDHATVKDL